MSQAESTSVQRAVNLVLSLTRPYCLSSSVLLSFHFSIWGEAVNVASRMESTGIPGKIHCTKAVVDLVESYFEFESRGPVDIKSVGMMNTFILTERKRLVPASSATVRRSRQRRSSLLMESLKTLKSSRQLLQKKIEDLQNRISDNGANSDDSESNSDSSSGPSDARFKI